MHKINTENKHNSGKKSISNCVTELIAIVIIIRV